MADVKESAARFIRAFNGHDENAMRLLNAPGIVFEAPGGVHLQGKDVTGYSMGWLKACPDGKITVQNQIISGPWVVEQVRFEGTHQGPLQSPAGTIPATGKRLNVKAAMVTRFENELAIESHVYFDQIDVLSQLGVSAPVAVTV
jgi:predicted ester cyclase